MRPAARLWPLAVAITIVPGNATAEPAIRADQVNEVPACATPGRLMALLRHRNPALERRFDGIAIVYAREGSALGVRWDYAFFQMIVETGALSFRRGDGQPGTVGAHQNNFAGIGAVSGRDPGESFADIAAGVRAHLQHVILYTGARVPEPIAERTRKVQEWGFLTTWQRSLGRPTTFGDLARKWAPDNRGYWSHIEGVARRFQDQFCSMIDPAPAVDVASRVPPPGATPAPAPPPAVSWLAMAKRALEEKQQQPVGLGGKTLEPTPTERLEPRQAPAAPTAQAPPAPPRQRTASVMPPPAKAPARTVVPTPIAAPAVTAPPKPTADDIANDKLRQLVSGRTIVLDTPIGTTIPIEFAEDGRMRGKAGGLAGFLGAAVDEGQWWPEKGKLCQRWKVWFKGELQCLKFRQSGQIIHWVADNGRSGTAKLVGP